MKSSNQSTVLPTDLHKNNTWNLLIGYGLFVLGLISGIFLIPALIWLYYYRKPTDAFQQSHIRYLLSTCKWGAAWLLISAILTQLVVGYFLVFFVWFWCIYRLIKGIVYCINNKVFKGANHV